MGNPQERLAWLAGVIDGEGTISIQCYTKPNGHIRLTPYISIANSNQLIIDEVKSILSTLCGARAVRLCTSKREQAKKNPCYMLRMDGPPAVYKVLSEVTPHLVGKFPQAELVLGFIESRAENLLERDSLGRIKRRGYTEKEVGFVDSLRKMHKRESSETTRSAPNYIG